MKEYLRAGRLYACKDYMHFTIVSLQPGFSEIRELSTLFDWNSEFHSKEWKPVSRFEFQNAFNTALSKIIQHQTIEMEKDQEADS